MVALAFAAVPAAFADGMGIGEVMGIPVSSAQEW